MWIEHIETREEMFRYLARNYKETPALSDYRDFKCLTHQLRIMFPRSQFVFETEMEHPLLFMPNVEYVCHLYPDERHKATADDLIWCFAEFKRKGEYCHMISHHKLHDCPWKRRMNVGTINYWHVSGPSPGTKNEKLRQLWRELNLDLLLVQEGIGGWGNIIYGTTNSIRDLARMLNANHVSTACFPCRFWPSWISRYAIGVIARGQISKVQPILIGKRTHLSLEVDGLPVVVVHLDPHDSIDKQLFHLAQCLPKDGPVVVGGDFNHMAAPAMLEKLAQTAPQPETNLIDHIIWRGFNGQVKSRPVDFSDHPFVWAILA